MTPADWHLRAASLATLQASAIEDSHIAMTEALLDLHLLMIEAPNAILLKYKNLHEAWLHGLAADRKAAIGSGHLGWQVPQVSDPLAWLLAIGGQIRALDDYLIRNRDDDGRPDDPNENYLSRRGDHFIIPRKSPRAAPGARENRSYHRRGMLHHRVLPVELKGYPVRLIWQDTIAPAAGPLGAPRHGAAMFRDLTLHTEPAGEGFVATGVTCRDAEATVAAQIEAALEHPCISMVWPELTVPPPLLLEIRRQLADRAKAADPRIAPQIVVAGSWHQTTGSITRNVATVLDGYGAETLSYEKMVPFRSDATGPEAIEMGTELPVIVTDDQLVAFAICRDFCDKDVDVPYPELDVDLMLVPSMGNDDTMTEHLDVAKRIKVRFGCRTFIVQQRTAPDDAGALGYVLPVPRDPKATPVSDLRQFDTWASHVG